MKRPAAAGARELQHGIWPLPWHLLHSISTPALCYSQGPLPGISSPLPLQQDQLKVCHPCTLSPPPASPVTLTYLLWAPEHCFLKLIWLLLCHPVAIWHFHEHLNSTINFFKAGACLPLMATLRPYNNWGRCDTDFLRVCGGEFLPWRGASQIAEWSSRNGKGNWASLWWRKAEREGVSFKISENKCLKAGTSKLGTIFFTKHMALKS